MQVSNVTNADGQQMANVINFLKAGRWELSGKDADALVECKRWIASIAMDMAKQLNPPTKPTTAAVATPAPAPAAPAASMTDSKMRIKGMGPIGGGSGKKKK